MNSKRFLRTFGLLTAALVAMTALPGQAQERDKTAAAVFSPKPTAPIGIAHAFAVEPAVGQPLTVTLTVTPSLELTDAVLTLGAEEALSVIEPVGEVDLGTIAAGESVEVELSVLPLAAETHYLRVSVAGVIRGRPQIRSIAVPIRLAEPALQRKPANDAAVGSTEEAVRSFQAEETVR